MLTSGMLESKQDSICLPADEMEFESVRVAIHFMYTNELPDLGEEEEGNALLHAIPLARIFCLDERLQV